MGAVRLVVADRARMQAFYEQSIGLQILERRGNEVWLGVKDDALVSLIHNPDAPARPRPSTGLFHLAVLVPSRPELARAIRRVVDSGWSFTGASDHLVSEAMYLDDPEGNGIEIYRDRPRSEWVTNGELKMATLPLDIDGIMDELPADAAGSGQMAEGTKMGHVHLQVADIPSSESFYCRVLGFDATVRSYPGALFVSAGGYHHHIGLNVWGSAGASPPNKGARGMDAFEITLPSHAALDELEARVETANIPVERSDAQLRLADPSGNRVVITAG
jgi:catechol 2,3-dioxygenase